MKPFSARTLLLSSAVLLSALPARAVNWVNQGYSPGIDGFNPRETTISASNVSTLALAWQSTTTDINGVYGMVEDGGRIFVESNDSTGTADIVALNASSGAEQWKASLNAADSIFGTISGIAAGGARVFTPCVENNQEGYCALAQKTGKLAWFDSMIVQGRADGGPLYRPTFAGSTVYVSSGTCDNNQVCNVFSALNATTGAVIWATAPSASGLDWTGWSESPAVSSSTGLDYQPCDYVFNGNSENTFLGLCTFSTSTGAAGWQYGLLNDGQPFSQVAGVSVSGNSVFFNQVDENNNRDVLTALDASTGSVSWTFDTVLSSRDLVQPTVGKGAVYWPDGNGTLWALKEKTGATLWSTSNWGSFCSPVNGTESQPQEVNGVIFITTSCQNTGTRYVTNFALASSNGNVLWQDSEGFNTIPILATGTAPMIVNGELYADCVNVCAYALPGGSARRPKSSQP